MNKAVPIEIIKGLASNDMINGRVEGRVASPWVKEELRPSQPPLQLNDHDQETKIEELRESIEELKRALNHKIYMEVDQELERVIVKIVDPETGKLIRQIPPEELLEISRRLHDMQGILFDKEV